MIKLTPPMGWNSWNTFGHDIDENMIKETADVMVSSGLLAAGYDYLVIDDCWQEKKRGKDGRLVASKEKFPSGMKAIADYVHSKGLKFGMYTCVGTMTCGEYPGSNDYEFIDAQSFAEWEVDYLKVDYCFKPSTDDGAVLYKRMALALDNCGRDILLSACSWGADETYKWIKQTGASLWRSTGDIVDSWESIKDLVEREIPLQQYNGIGCFNDMDMLVVGMRGRGNVGLTGCTDDEYRTHFSLWALLNSPLMIGCDIRSMDEETKKILTNKELIKINQDGAGRQPHLITNNTNHMIWVKHLENGDLAIGLFNMTDNNLHIFFSFADIGINRSTGKSLHFTDVWTNEESTYYDSYVDNLAPHTCKVFRAKLVDHEF